MRARIGVYYSPCFSPDGAGQAFSMFGGKGADIGSLTDIESVTVTNAVGTPQPIIVRLR